MDSNLNEIRTKLDELDDQFKELESTIESHTNQYVTIINELSSCESQNKIVDIRLRNQQILKESIVHIKNPIFQHFKCSLVKLILAKNRFFL